MGRIISTKAVANAIPAPRLHLVSRTSRNARAFGRRPRSTGRGNAPRVGFVVLNSDDGQEHCTIVVPAGTQVLAHLQTAGRAWGGADGAPRGLITLTEVELYARARATPRSSV